MTRINVGIDPKELPDSLLLAEHREIKRIPNGIVSGKLKTSKCPKDFTLGTGHVKFFVHNMKYLQRRYDALFCECIQRGFDVTYYASSFYRVPKALMNLYCPSPSDRSKLVERIRSKGFELKRIPQRNTDV